VEIHQRHRQVNVRSSVAQGSEKDLSDEQTTRVRQRNVKLKVLINLHLNRLPQAVNIPLLRSRRSHRPRQHPGEKLSTVAHEATRQPVEEHLHRIDQRRVPVKPTVVDVPNQNRSSVNAHVRMRLSNVAEVEASETTVAIVAAIAAKTRRFDVVERT